MNWQVVLVLVCVGVLAACGVGVWIWGRGKDRRIAVLEEECALWRVRTEEARDQLERLLMEGENRGLDDDEAIKKLRERLRDWTLRDSG